MFPRYVPTPHLHEGTDIFAETGTPIVASGPGTFMAANDTLVGGRVVWVVGDNGDAYYYAHLDSFPDDLKAGDRVDAGTVIGFVGNTGNAIFSSPHLHFEIHPAIRDAAGNIVVSGVSVGPTGIAHSRTPPVNPKPYLDQWLSEAETRAQAFVVTLMQRLSGLARQIHFSQRVDDLYQAESLQRPKELVWFSLFDPTIGAVGFARHAAADASLASVKTKAEASLEQRRLSAVRLALDAPGLKILGLTGGLNEVSSPIGIPGP